MLLQQQADDAQKKLDARKAQLAALDAIGPAQRAVNRENGIEDFSVKITGLTKAVDDAKTAYENAQSKANLYHSNLDAAMAADTQMKNLYDDKKDNDALIGEAGKEQQQKEAELASLVTVDDAPSIKSVSVTTDLRKPTFYMGSGVVTLIMALMIVGEFRRPKIITGVQPPAAAPLVNQQLRKIPWPQPHELEGLNPAQLQPEKVFG